MLLHLSVVALALSSSIPVDVQYAPSPAPKPPPTPSYSLMDCRGSYTIMPLQATPPQPCGPLTGSVEVGYEAEIAGFISADQSIRIVNPPASQGIVLQENDKTTKQWTTIGTLDTVNGSTVWNCYVNKAFKGNNLTAHCACNANELPTLYCDKCKPQFQNASTQCYDCNTNYFGQTCQPCSCSNGNCSDGRTGNGMCKTCKPGFFGVNCTKPCTCAHGKCNDGPKGDGHCLKGSSCEPNFYGPDCTKTCGCETAHGTCNNTVPSGNGNCLKCSGPQYVLPLCDCAAGHAGANCAPCSCNQKAGHCLNSTKSDGHCMQPCDNKNFNGTDCNLCHDGYFGPTCTTRCSCEHGTCSDGPTGTGKCVGACQVGWTGDNCDSCAEGFGGSDCKPRMTGPQVFGCRTGFELNVLPLAGKTISAKCMGLISGANSTYVYDDATPPSFISKGGFSLEYDPTAQSLVIRNTKNEEVLSTKDSQSSSQNWLCGSPENHLGINETVVVTGLLSGQCDCSLNASRFLTGVNCTQCLPGYYGKDCSGACRCKEGICSEGTSGTGDCKPNTCQPNFEGKDCDVCAAGNFGPDCSKHCTCPLKTGICDNGPKGTGKCTSCINHFNVSAQCGDCNAGFFGPMCTKNCTCLHGTCDSGINGNGQCKSGSCIGNYQGSDCNQCKPGFFNTTCSPVKCGSHGICGAACQGIAGNGLCTSCQGNWDIKKQCTDCLPNFFGANCSKEVMCSHGTPSSGVKGNGACLPGTCQKGWAGANCSDCDAYHTGINCDTPCTCKFGICNSGPKGDGMCKNGTCFQNYDGPNCDHCTISDCQTCVCEHGKCEKNDEKNGTVRHCQAGTCETHWAGADCNDCTSTLFGQFCNKTCTCQHGTCDSGVNGTGTCKGACDSHWGGVNCADCSDTYFGANCATPCTCLHGTCQNGLKGNGHCVAGQCDKGWNGTDCQECANSFFGPYCNKTCTCQHGICNNNQKTGNGTCLSCYPGFMGINCDTCKKGYFGPSCAPCNCKYGTCNDGIKGDGTCSSCTSPTVFGPNCNKNCTCLHGKCNAGIHGNGTCAAGSCQGNFTGNNCDSCKPNVFGKTCNLACKCSPSGTLKCNDGPAGNGTCTCKAAYNGTTCTECATGHFGSQCAQTKCTCQHGTCSTGTPTSTGKCIPGSCKKGYVGDLCDECLPHLYGPTCQPCKCVNGICDDGIKGTGDCKGNCSQFFSGIDCQNCEKNHYGKNCLQNCTCDPVGTSKCQDGISGDGTCICNNNFDGPSCGDCTREFFGPTCSKPVTCKNGSPNSGKSGDGHCSKCSPGYSGKDCDDCEAGYFGPTCQECGSETKNSCLNGACDDGIKGSGTCKKNSCKAGFYGPLCDKQCACDTEHGVCDDNTGGTGNCSSCTGSYTGPLCDSCQKNHFGEFCLQCTCESDHSSCADSYNGTGACTCSDGYSGPNCEQPKTPIPVALEGSGHGMHAKSLTFSAPSQTPFYATLEPNPHTNTSINSAGLFVLNTAWVDSAVYPANKSIGVKPYIPTLTMTFTTLGDGYSLSSCQFMYYGVTYELVPSATTFPNGLKSCSTSGSFVCDQVIFSSADQKAQLSIEGMVLNVFGASRATYDSNSKNNCHETTCASGKKGNTGGIVAGVIVAVLVVGVAVFFFLRRRQNGYAGINDTL
eukprot:m.43178 g.43178  ORF g.43178 m.43178 type:complete len:1651 (+) comp9956_c0_seq1:64-5016(+)